MTYAVKIEQFEGPFALLVELIEKKELSINEISLARIADQYLDHLKKLDNFPLEEVASFIVVASTLMLIKSRSLLPNMEISDEEEKSITDLEDRLRVYQKIRTLALGIKEKFGKELMFERDGFKGVEIGFLEPEGVNINTLHELLKNVLESLPAKEKLPEVEVKKIVSLEEKILELTERIQNNLATSFKDFANSKNYQGAELKAEIIISFLAMLELVKQGIILAKQETHFNNISIEKQDERIG